MKFSLREFFLREEKSSSKHSSVNIDVKSSAQINIKEAGWPAGAKTAECPYCGNEHEVDDYGIGFCPKTNERFQAEDDLTDPDTCEVCGQQKGNPKCKYCRDPEKEMGRAERMFGEEVEEPYEFDFDIAYDVFDRKYVERVAAKHGVTVTDVNMNGPGGGNPQVFASAPDYGTAREFLTDLYGEPPEWMDEKKLSSYEHPRTHLAKKFSKQKGVKDPWALAQSVKSRNEALEEAQSFQLNEFEHVPPVPRPGATAWSSPSEPVTVKKFFNNDDGHLDIDLQGDRKSGLKKEAQYGSGYPDKWDLGKNGPIRRGTPGDPQNIEIPMGDMDDFGYIGGEEEFDQDDGGAPMAGVFPRRGSNPHQHDWTQSTQFNDDEPIKMSEGGKGSGRKKGSKNKPKGSTIVSPGGPVGPTPDEPPPGFFDGDQSDINFRPSDQPSDPSGFERQEGDLGDDLSWLDDPDLGKDIGTIQKAEPRAPKAAAPKPERDTTDWQSFKPSLTSFFDQARDEELPMMSWQELKAEKPKETEEIESWYPEIVDMKRHFFIDKNGDIIMRSHDGGRKKYDPEQGFIDMDDGQTPAGEF